MKRAKYEVFEWLLNQDGVRTADVCKATGISSSTISHWKQGKYTPKQEKINAIAEYFGIAPWAFTAEIEDLPTYNRRKRSPVYDVAAGPGHFNEATTSEYMAGADTSEEYSYARVHGDSMLPVLQDGDIVKVHHQTETAPSDYTVVKINGDEATIKHVEIVDNGVWLRAENKEVFPDKFYTIQEVMSLPVQVIGKAVEIRREL